MFKVGDKVLIIDSYFGSSLYTIRKIVQRAGFVSLALFEESGFFRLSGIRHATPEEIAAGYRIDCEILDHPEDYTSPNCKKFDEQVK